MPELALYPTLPNELALCEPLAFPRPRALAREALGVLRLASEGRDCQEREGRSPERCLSQVEETRPGRPACTYRGKWVKLKESQQHNRIRMMSRVSPDLSDLR